ncbi:NUDIX hydrolase [Actinomadura sp. 21ATH]|uniref:NUDIX hydrolase n=1 Tax=Actinomadura sp. 21ATH TaxID=1735444 RepID=UPI0035C15017
MAASTASPFARIKIRVGALVFCGDEVALIRRDRPGSTHFSPPGGNVEHGEDLLAALRRELAEELDLAPSQAGRSCSGSSTRWSPAPGPPRRRASCT